MNIYIYIHLAFLCKTKGVHSCFLSVTLVLVIGMHNVPLPGRDSHHHYSWEEQEEEGGGHLIARLADQKMLLIGGAGGGADEWARLWVIAAAETHWPLRRLF